MESETKRTFNKRAIALVALHVLLLIYSLSGILSKNAAQQAFLSPAFIALYAGMLAILGVYAIGWQQILKRLPLTVAFANKAVAMVWGIAWGIIFFGESITWPMVVGAAFVIVGAVLFSIFDAQDQEAEAAQDQEAEAAQDQEAPNTQGGDA